MGNSCTFELVFVNVVFDFCPLFAVTVNALQLAFTVLSHVHVKIASTNLFMKIPFLQLVSRLNLAIHLHLLPK